MKYTFKRTNPDVKVWQGMNTDLKDNLTEILNGSCSAEEIREFCYFAVAQAKPLKHDHTMVFWGYAEPNTMPSDARCEFVYQPTYLMVQIMIASVLRVPEMMADKRFTATLEYGLNGCCGRNLQGHGIDNEEVVENVKSFMRSGYAEFDMRYPQINRKFKRMIKNAATAICRYQPLLEVPAWFLGQYECKEDETFYIAYGSNLNRNQMAERCPGAELVGIGVLPQTKLEFYLHATVEESDKITEKVPVALWKISKDNEESLDRYEGVSGHYYKKSRAEVILNNGCKAEGLIYLMENFRQQPVGEDYYRGIEAAYRELGLANQIDKVLKPAKDRSMAR